MSGQVVGGRWLVVGEANQSTMFARSRGKPTIGSANGWLSTNHQPPTTNHGGNHG